MGKNIKVAVAGVGNCASSLVQGVEYYRDRSGSSADGIMRPNLHGQILKLPRFASAQAMTIRTAVLSAALTD